MASAPIAIALALGIASWSMRRSGAWKSWQLSTWYFKLAAPLGKNSLKICERNPQSRCCELQMDYFARRGENRRFAMPLGYHITNSYWYESMPPAMVAAIEPQRIWLWRLERMKVLGATYRGGRRPRGRVGNWRR